ncbi:MAG: hypothetical protein ABJA18_07675 [bacterium]
MKTTKAICAAALLALSLSIPAYADDPTPTPGEQHTPGCPIPAPGDTETPKAPENGGFPAGSSATDGDISSLNIADILWALGLVY